jgi:hypothetical protein
VVLLAVGRFLVARLGPAPLPTEGDEADAADPWEPDDDEDRA